MEAYYWGGSDGSRITLDIYLKEASAEVSGLQAKSSTSSAFIWTPTAPWHQAAATAGRSDAAARSAIAWTYGWSRSKAR